MFLRSALICFLLNSLGISGDELVATVIVFRHGARTPRLFHPNDPYKSPSYWPAPVGELTEEGKVQAYELGKWARQRYSDFLPQKYSSKDFFIYSSGLDRTLMSASLFAAGLYPSTNTSNLPYQPVPIHSKPPDLDNTILTDQPCPRQAIIFKQIINSEFFKNLDKQHQEVYNYLSVHMGMPITTFIGLHAYYDTFFIEERHNLTLPEWTKKVYPEKLLELSILNLYSRGYNTENLRFRAGPLYSEILAYFTSFSENPKQFTSGFKMNKSGRKMLAISGHDVNISDLLSVLKYPVDFWPSYSSSVIFELRKKEDQGLFVSVLFRNTTGLFNVNVAGEKENSLINFVEFVKPVIVNPLEWKKLCRGATPK